MITRKVHFLKLYTLIFGKDYASTSFLYGYKLGLGFSDIKLSEYANTKVSEAGITNLDTSFISNLQAAIRLGYSKVFTYEYPEFELNILYDAELFWEYSMTSEETSEKAQLIYDRYEILQQLIFNARWTF